MIVKAGKFMGGIGPWEFEHRSVRWLAQIRAVMEIEASVEQDEQSRQNLKERARQKAREFRGRG